MSTGSPSTPDENGSRNFKVTQLGTDFLHVSAELERTQPHDTIFRLYVTSAALCFGRVGEVYLTEEMGASYDNVRPLEPEFLEIHPLNFRISMHTIQRILLDRRPHLHNPVNGGSLHIWFDAVGAVSNTPDVPAHTGYTFLLDYTTDADQLLDALIQACQAAGRHLPEVREDPALTIELNSQDSTSALLHIQLQWQRGMGLLLLVFALCWSGLIAYLASVMVAAYSIQPGILNAVIIFSLMLFLLAGLFLVYYALTHIFNTTRLTLSKRRLLIHSGPLPWSGAARAINIPPGAEIYINTRRLEHWNEYPSITTYVYDLVVAAPDTPPRRLISLSRLPHALRVRKALHAALR